MNAQTLTIQQEQHHICAVYGCVNESKKVIESAYIHNETKNPMFETRTALCKVHADIISETEATNNKVRPLSKSF
jgi:hypothetical protein